MDLWCADLPVPPATGWPPFTALGSPRRAWDGYDVCLFDIDGTLMLCRDAVHYRMQFIITRFALPCGCFQAERPDLCVANLRQLFASRASVSD